MASESANGLILKNQAKLSELSARVKLIHRDILASARATVERAVEAGKWLSDMKGLLSHGQFEKYLEDNKVIGTRTARRYMELNEKWPLIEKELGPDASGVTIDGCLRVIKPAPKPKTACQAEFPPTEVCAHGHEAGEEAFAEDSDLGLDPSVAEAARAIRAKREALEKGPGNDQGVSGGVGVRTGKATAKNIEAALEKQFGILTELLEDYHALKPDNLHFDCQQALDSCYGDFRSWKKRKPTTTE